MAKSALSPFFWLTTLTTLLPNTPQAQTPPHDSSNDVSCKDCHHFIIQNGIMKITVPREVLSRKPYARTATVRMGKRQA